MSGCTDTTLMNTIRMSTYVRYAVERLGIIDYQVWVKGDDTVLFLKQEHVEAVEHSLS